MRVQTALRRLEGCNERLMRASTAIVGTSIITPMVQQKGTSD